MSTETTKACIGCKLELPLDHFYRLRRGEEERQSRCKPCDNAKRAGSMRNGGAPRWEPRPQTPPSMDGNRGRVDVVRNDDGSLAMVRR